MFFDIGWSEIVLIGGVALVVVGPKELPKALRTAGFWVRKARNMSREFQSSIEQMIREAELDDMQKQFKQATSLDLNAEFHKTIDPDGSLARDLEPPKLPDFSLKPGSGRAAAPAHVGSEAAATGQPVLAPPPMHGFDPPN